MSVALAVPNLGEYGDMSVLLDLARRAEAAGWDALFLWDHVNYRVGEVIAMVEPWTALAAIAADLGTTARLGLGVLVTPLARRRPWVLARQIAAVSQLAPGRVVCGAGLGTPADAEFEAFGEPGDDRERSVRLDEALVVLRSLLDGERVTFRGVSTVVDDVQFPGVSPRVPIWVAGRWPNKRPLRRSARYDGLYVEKQGGGDLSPADVAAAVAYVRSARATNEPFDVAVPGRTSAEAHPRGSEVARLAQYAIAGATWWIEYLGPKRAPLDELLVRVDAGPVRP